MTTIAPVKLTVIGAGNIGGATALGLANAAEVTATARTQATLDRFKGTRIRTSLDNLQAAKDADIVVFAVKPWLMEEVVKSILPVLDNDRQVIVSMAPGVKSEDFLSWLGPDFRLAYVIPNTAIEVGESMTFIVPVTTTDSDNALLEQLFSEAGQTMTVSERMLGAGTSLASCGIAYALRYIHAAAQGGVELGFFADEAAKIVAQTVKGAAAILEAHGTHPETEIDKVTTPGGMTIKGLNAMEDAGFTPAVIKGLKANK